MTLVFLKTGYLLGGNINKHVKYNYYFRPITLREQIH